VPQITDAGLRARALADQATAAALEADWPRAADLNQKLIDVSPDDLEARNRLGRALLELGRLDHAAVVETTSRAANRLAVLLEGIIGHL